MTRSAAGEVGVRRPTHHPFLLGLVLALIAANLRPALAAVGPVLSDLRTDVGLSGVGAALLTAVPVICLGALAATAPALARRWGMEPVIAAVLAAIVVGQLVRVFDGIAVLFAGTIVVSGAIAVANVLLPAIIKRDFPTRTATMMGVYTMAVSGSAAVASGLTVPLTGLVGHGWRGGLGAWAAPVLVALVSRLPLVRQAHVPDEPAPGGALRWDPLAWRVTAFFGLQSLSFYAVLAWLPSIYRDHGYSAVSAGLLLSVSGLAQIPVALFLPGLAIRAVDQRVHAAVCTLLIAVGLAGILAAPTSAPYLWTILLGIGQGGTFAVGLTLFVLRTGVAADTARLSAMAQTFGYLIAAFGPLLVGTVHDATRSWTAPLVLLLVLLVPQLVSGVLAGRRRCITR
jgi:CP family cyanate transporter-like MFS transporter